MQTSTRPLDDHAALGHDTGAAEPSPQSPRAPYVPPMLERLGSWEAVTLQMSVPIFP